MLADYAGFGGRVLPCVEDVVDLYLNGARKAVVVYRELSDDGFEEELRAVTES